MSAYCDRCSGHGVLVCECGTQKCDITVLCKDCLQKDDRWITCSRCNDYSECSWVCYDCISAKDDDINALKLEVARLKDILARHGITQ
jgi:hypothetical protein